jgi:hypothetical protein
MKVHGPRILSPLAALAVPLLFATIVPVAKNIDAPQIRFGLVQGDVRLSVGGGKLGFVAPHPNDVQDQPPANLKHGIFVPPSKPAEPFQRINGDPSQKVQVLEKTPKEFHGASASHLPRPPRPRFKRTWWRKQRVVIPSRRSTTELRKLRMTTSRRNS